MPAKKTPPEHCVEVVVLGLEGSGKSSLVRQLRGLCQGGLQRGGAIDVPPTVGVELDNWTWEHTRLKVKEVGGTFVATWLKYCKSFDVLIYMVDLSNPKQLSASIIELFNLLAAPSVAPHPVLVLLSKTDMPVAFPASTFYHFSQIHQLKQHNPDLSITLLEVSAFTHHNLDAVLCWLMERRRPFTHSD
eukprot:NODE_5111_length_697_cov_68.494737_g4948_i0.p1 GENE.NODE_5111_length_697_cov_68.494737_g4948_i0~~NODE_5111_length_697_cov_68.494737_g4948_i0.p1  ORF type:complete len:189 (-),score=60.76 NODE_5111_length_697_cov_68.494737_g4948_i0:66-632(-)